MGKTREEFDCFSWFGHSSKSRIVNSELDPVLLIPGIAGSILDAVNKKDGSSERVWVRMLMASCEFKKKLWAVYNPETGYAEPLDTKIKIEVPDDDYGLYAIDMLDPSWVGCDSLSLNDMFSYLFSFSDNDGKKREKTKQCGHCVLYGILVKIGYVTIF